MQWFPSFVRLEQARVLVVGAGDVAARKVELLLKTQANIVVVAPEANSELRAWAEAGRLMWVEREYQSADLLGARIAFAATADPVVNKRVALEARAANVLVNVVDTPEECSFIVPSIVDRDPVLVAISTAGKAPVLGRRIREQLEVLLPTRLGAVADIAGRWRPQIKAALPDFKSRLRFWESLFDERQEALLNSHADDADGSMQQWLQESVEQSRASAAERGEVYLVGGGPGDPELLTLKALRLMQRCDIVFYDRLVSPAVMALVRKDAERVYVGKKSDKHPVPQEEINALLVKHASKGQRVLRLKGGDPFIFGRGGEEIEELMAAGLRFQVVPGITAAAGCASYAGIPLTHRDHAQSCQFVTGHRRDGQLDLDWPNLARKGQTLVFYMGVQSAAELSKQLQAHGLPPSYPVAVIEKGTTPNQRVLVATLESLKAELERAAIKPPSLIIVGEVVGLRPQLNWYQGRG